MLDIQMQSEQLNEYTTAMAKAQLAFEAVAKDSEGQAGQRKYLYPSLASVISATRKGLSENGLTIDGIVWDGFLVVTVMHVSGQFKRSALQLPDPADKWQAFGSAETYARRYLYLAMLSLAGEDDDAVEAQRAGQQPKPDPMQPLWDALDAIGIGPGASTQAWCEKTLGRKVPSVDGLSKDDFKTLLDAAKCLKATPPSTQTKSESTAQPLATEQQCNELNDALNKLHPWDQDAVAKLAPKDAAKAKLTAKLAWINGMLRLSTPIAATRSLKSEEIKKLIECANNGEVPECEATPMWMDEPQQRKE